jgi:hypothetical protein
MERNDAARALREAEVTATRSATAARYEQASYNLIIWGGVWTLVNIAGLLELPFGTILFPVFMVLGGALSIGVSLRRPGLEARRTQLRRTALTAAAVFLFVTGVFVVSPTGSLIQVEAVACLATGAAYIVASAALGWRLAAIGVAQIAGTIFVWLYGREQFFLWMAVFGGGGLILGGLWLRKA